MRPVPPPRNFVVGYFPRRKGRIMATTFTLNGKSTTVNVDPQMPLLWVLRDTLRPDRHQVRLRHGAVRRLHRARRRRSRRAPASRRSPAVQGKKVTTIEGLSADGCASRADGLDCRSDVPQCGYCQSGQIMSAAALLAENAEAHRRGHRRRHERQHLPLRHLPAHPRRHPPRGRFNQRIIG